MGRPKKAREVKAWEEARKALKWIAISGVGLTLLNTLRELLEALQNGSMDWNQVLAGLAYALAFATINFGIYYMSEYQKAQ